LRVNAWATHAFSKSDVQGYLRNNIKIPGTFPSDSRRLHVKIQYELRQYCGSYSGFGYGYAESYTHTYQSQGTTDLLVFSPVLWGANKSTSKTIIEDYILEKKDVAQSVFGARADTFAFANSASWAFTDLNSIKWTICEE
jgi:hypothetical protein